MDGRHDKGTLLLCLAVIIEHVKIVLQWTQRYYHSKAEEPAAAEAAARFGSSSVDEGNVEEEVRPLSVGGRVSISSSGETVTTATNTAANIAPEDSHGTMMAQVMSHPAPIDLPDNKQKDDGLTACGTTAEYYHIEQNRLRTFDQWPVAFISSSVLARYGFYYLGTDDTVKCYFCTVEIGLWEPQDDVVEEHLRWSPFCPLLKKRPTNNVPINANFLDAVPAPSYDTCGITFRPHSYAENESEQHVQTLERMSGESWGAASESSHSSSSISGTSYGVDESSEFVGGAGGTSSRAQLDHHAVAPITVAEYNSGVMTVEPIGVCRPEYPAYAIEADRLKSYEDWPTSLKQKPQQLSDAGFFYTGKSDRVKCFSCGGGLKDWEQDDDPWQQHAIWYSNCHYLQLMKEPEFIRKCMELKEKIAEEHARAVSSASSQPSTSGISSGSSSIMSTSPASSSGLSSPTPAAALEDDDHTLRCSSGVSSGDENGGKRDGTGCQKVVSEGKICKICFVNEYNTAFMPCGHVVACAKCASSVNKCPLCQQPFINVLRLYLS